MDARLTGIDRREVLQYLGVRGEPDNKLTEQLSACIRKLMEGARPRVLWRVFAREPDGTLAGTEFCPRGEAIARHLEGCGEVILMAATLGSEAERLMRRAQTGDMGEALLLDACGSAAIENVCNNLCSDLETAFRPRYLTERFSPGYGDFPLEQQRELFAVLDVTRRIGISLSAGGLMLPQKSVTALIGVSQQPQKRRERSCDDCPMKERCVYRKDGTSCAFK